MPENIEASASWLDTIAVPAWGEPMASGVIKAAMSALLNNDAWLREKLEQETRSRDGHVSANKGVHGATSSATAERIIERDANGRAHVGDPTAATHIATRGWTEQALNSHKPDWPDIRNKPQQATRWPKFSEVTDKPTTFTPASHSHPWSSITGKPSLFPPSSHSHSWGSITGKPSSFPPSSHSHSWESITGKPAAFPPALPTDSLEREEKLISDTWTPPAGWYIFGNATRVMAYGGGVPVHKVGGVMVFNGSRFLRKEDEAPPQYVYYSRLY